MDIQLLHFLSSIGRIAGIMFVFVYILGPIQVKFRQSTKVRPPMQPYDPATLPPEAASFFYNSVQALVGAGFTVIDYVMKPGAHPLVTPVIVYMVHRTYGDRVAVACFYSTVNGVTTIKNNSIFCQRNFSDGTIVSTTHLPPTGTYGCYKTRPYVTGTRISHTSDAAELYRIHCFAVAKHAGHKTALVPPVGGELEAFEESDADVNNFQVKSGILQLNRTQTAYVPTWFGAYYMTWSLLWPFKQMRAADSRAKCRKLMADYARNVT